MEIKCLECGELIVPKKRTGRRPKYCSRKCYEKQYYRHPEDAKDTPKNALCGRPSCGKPFEKKKRNQRYCSRDCYEKAWVEINRERYNARSSRNYHRDIEKSRSRSRETYRKTRALSAEETPWLYIFKSRKYEAKNKNIPFELTKEWCRERWTGKCELTGIAFRKNLKRGPHPFSPSIDKIDPNKGYTQTNCRFVLLSINTFKHSGTDADMYEIAEALIANKPQNLP